MGVADAESVGKVLRSKDEQEELEQMKKSGASVLVESPAAKKKALEDDDSANDADVEKEEDEDQEEIYTDSSAFLKGTQSANPHNDYCQNFVDTGERPQNYIRDVGLANRFEEYPKLRQLISLKDELIQNTNTPPMYMHCDLETFDMRDLDSKFDVILIEPPLEEYQRYLGVSRDKFWSWQDIENLQIESIAAQRSFIWIWCGFGEGLDAARKCLRKWGFRRCEDICWIKTNIKNPKHNKNLGPTAIFQRTKEHCLMGIKGTVRRSIDGDFIHANVDIDLIIEEEFPPGSDEKPVEIFHIIEHFCLGKRRLHIFGRDLSIRPGWLTIGPDVTNTNYNSKTYNGYFNKTETSFLTGCSEEIERLRPKSPPPKDKNNPKGQGRGGGRGGGKGGGGARGGRGGNFSGRGNFQGRGRGGQRSGTQR